MIDGTEHANSDQAAATGSAGNALKSREGTQLTDETVNYADGSVYMGQVLNQQREGRGIYKCGSDLYEGEWHNDKQHGAGCQTWSDGRSYEGQFQFGRFGGKGRMAWSTAKGTMIYEGEYMGDVKHGIG